MGSKGDEAIAIIGSACRFPGNSDSPSKLWEVLSDPKDLCGPVPTSRFNAAGFYHKNSAYHGHSNVHGMKSYFLSEEAIERQFDAPFFGISAAEANVLDPQVRLLLETTYEALEAAGQSMESLQGSDTGCYVGLMMGEYEVSMLRDIETIAQYHVTGTARSLMSNRLSYFFDWHGPSMTIDTACSSSMVAVHQSVQLLRSHGANLAVAAGANLILDPITHISESKLQMLSPDGRGRMWDAAANGYARGEGVATLVLKRLSDAIRDGDHIECIIRETGINQDGKTRGITMPSSKAQADLIGQTYHKAGLDLTNPHDRPQYFEAHGTGTPAGDPVEAEAIYSAFFKTPLQDGMAEHDQPPLLVGSIKTVLGHSEGTAGIAAILKTSLALQQSAIPPNMLLTNLNPRIKPFSEKLRVPECLVPWPAVESGQPRRASVNCFGFGGTNAHAILESFEDSKPSIGPQFSSSESTVFAPFVFSAASERSLKSYLSSFAIWLKENAQHIDLRSLSHSLHSCRSRLQYTTTVSALDTTELCENILAKFKPQPSSKEEPFGIRARPESKRGPVIVGVFTGQGAQSPAMGAELLAKSSTAVNIVSSLEKRLARLPEKDRPQWSLMEEMQRFEHSRVYEAALSQPLCTAVQIMLVDLLRSSGVTFGAVVGHSSGEVAAAYAAGVISAEDAICIAYYRGMCSSSAGGRDGQKGAMMAIREPVEDASELLDSHVFQGRAIIAAYNSSDSLTLSGDEDAIKELQAILEDEEKFARLLRVDKAYHSHHMEPCAGPYGDVLKGLGIQVSMKPTCTWISSVTGDDIVTYGLQNLDGAYWVKNGVSPVLFMQALQRTCDVLGPEDISLIIEIGPHPALKDPATQTIREVTGRDIPYTGLMKRKESDILSLSEGLGFIWSHLPKGYVNLEAFDHFVCGRPTAKYLKGLPTYSWDHDVEFWHHSSNVKSSLFRSEPHELLGHMTSALGNGQELQWRQILSPAEVSWINGHRLQNQSVLPAAAYVVLAIEACRELLQVYPDLDPESAALIHVHDIEIHQAMTFDSDNSRVEAVFSLSNINKTNDLVSASFKYFGSAADGSRGETRSTLRMLAEGSVGIDLGKPSHSILPPRSPRPDRTLHIEANDFYESLRLMGYEYSGPFRGLSGLERRLGTVTGSLSHDVEAYHDSNLLIHPAMLDVAFQAVLLAKAAPYDGTLWSMHVPKTIKRVTVNPSACAAFLGRQGQLAFDSCQPNILDNTFHGDVDVYPNKGSASPEVDEIQHAIIQVEGLDCVPFSRATIEDDREPLSVMAWEYATPDAEKAAYDLSPKPDSEELAFAQFLERVSFFYLQRLQRLVPSDDSCRSPGMPLSGLFQFARHIESRIKTGQLPFWRDEWFRDTPRTIKEAATPYTNRIDYRLLKRIGENLVEVVQGKTTAIEIARSDNILTEYYSNSILMSRPTTYLARTVQQISHRHPHLSILEVGAGTGVATNEVLDTIGDSFSSYAFTDISSGFFPDAQERFGSRSSFPRMTFTVLDIGNDPVEQGFEAEAYDVIIASMVLHATPQLRTSLQNTRRLLKPGGFLVLNEIINNDLARVGTIFGSFPGWWLGGERDGRTLGPAIPLAQWDQLLRKTGFSGCDSVVPVIDPFLMPNTVFVSQAVDARVEFLRKPLSLSSQAAISTLGLDSAMYEAVIIGGNSIATKDLVQDLKPLVQSHFKTIRLVSRLADIATSDIPITQATTILSLSDIDEPLCQNVTETQLQSIKDLLHNAGAIFWVTQGRLAEKPFANMTIGLVRSVLIEAPTLSFQSLDFEDAGAMQAGAIVEAFMRFKAGLVWDNDQTAPILMTVERELVVDKQGQVLLPRILPAKNMNNRYNSSMRPIHDTTRLVQGDEIDKVLGLKRDQDHEIYYLEEVETLADPDSFQITHSLALAYRIKGIGYTHISLATDKNASLHVILSGELTSTIRPLANLPPVRINENEGSHRNSDANARFLVLFALNMLAMFVIDDMNHRGHLLVYEPEPVFAAMLKKAAEDRGVSTTFMTSSMTPQRCAFLGWSYVHPQSPARTIRQLLSKKTSAFLVCTGGGQRADAASTEGRIIANLTSDCRTIYLADLCKPNAAIHVNCDEPISELQKSLYQAISRAREDQTLKDLRAITLDQVSAVRADENIASEDIVKQPMIIDWSRIVDVPVRVRPIDERTLFSGSKTYWLAGLSGTLGLSLCEWMIGCGARYFVITSRKPNVSPSWIDRMSTMGAVIKIFANDLTDLAQTESLYQDIHSIMPPLGGVAQGAMVLADASFRNMTIEGWQTVCRPKVQGTINIDTLLHDVDLDFFICFSSVSAVTGNPGQSNYSAANLFMASMVEQRRRRGLAASVIHIATILGVGYVAEKTQLMKTNFARTSGYSLHAERDFHQLFAEAVVAGRASCVKPHHPYGLSQPSEVTMGLHKVIPNPDKLPYWFKNPTISHFISHGDTRQIAKTTEKNESVKSLLSSAKTWDRVRGILQDSFRPFLCSLFQIRGSTELSDAQFKELLLDDLGLDSLLAVEIRTWWLKTVGVSLPVMKILSGITVGQLIASGMEGLSPDVTASVTSEDRHEPSQTELLDSARSKTPNGSEEEVTDTVESDPSETCADSPVTPNTAALDGPSPSNLAKHGFGEPTPLNLNHENVTVSSEPPPFVERWTELSPSQKMFWFILTFLDDKSGLNHTGMYRITGPIRLPNLEAAFMKLGQRHESLRTCFKSFDGWHPKQGIMETSRVRLEHRQISGAEEATLALAKLREHRYDLECGDCLQAIHLQQSSTVSYLLLGTHTMVLDGFSIYVLMQDLLRLYNDDSISSSVSRNRTICQYPAFAETQLKALRAGEFEEDLQFWIKEFSPCPSPMPPLTISSVSHHPVQSQYENHSAQLSFDSATKSKVQQLCRHYKIRPFHFFLTAFRAVLSRFSDVEEIAIGIGDANRTHEGALEGLGQYFNLLPLRFDNDSKQKFESALIDTKNKTDAALSHSRVPFQVLLEKLGVHRSPAHTPIFQSFFDYRQSLRERQPFGDCELELLAFDGARTPYDVSLEIIDDRDQDEYRLMLIVRADMYSEQDVGVLLKSYQKLVQAFASTPDIPFAQPDIFEAQEIDKALKFGLGEAVPSLWDSQSIVRRIQALANSNPTQLACKLPNGGEAMTYGEMMGKSRAIAETLTKNGCTNRSVVAVFQEPTPHWLCSLLAVFSIGATCVPFDAGILVERLAVMAEDSKVSVILTDNLIDDENLMTLTTRSSRKVINVEQIPFLDEQQKPTASWSLAPRPEDPALILYTSGSTGVPKGTVLRYWNLSNWAEFVAPCYFDGNGPGTVLQQTSIGFDIAYLQVFVALCYNGTLCIVPRVNRVDPSAITAIIADEGVNMTAGVPSELMNWLQYGNREALARSTKWKTICMGGEAVTIALLELQALLGPKPSPRFFHIYGPTETTITATSAEVFYEPHTSEPLCVGKPFPNYTAYVLDEQLRPLPPGVQGEVCFGGAGVASGYLGNETLTAEKFVNDAFAPASFKSRGWATLHRTGDKGRWRKDGSGLQIEGRRTGDTQHKLRGFRIDLQEVEKVMLKEAGGVLNQVVVTVRRKEPDSPEFLVAHAQFHPNHCHEDPHSEQLFLNSLASRLPLPQYMRPSITLPLKDVPVTTSGKLNRRAFAAIPLPENSNYFDHEVGGVDTSAIDLTETEAWLKEMWERVISKDIISTHQVVTDTDFFHVGGTSMLLLQLQAETRQKFELQVPLVQLFASSTLGSMARLIDQSAKADSQMAAIVDWDTETAILPQTQAALTSVAGRATNTPPRVIVLTGATGLLGQGILRKLIADPSIERIHCLAVRNAKARAFRLPPVLASDKVVLHEGDLTLPRLGLSEVVMRTVFESTDRIIHNGADTSHLKTYQSLRSPNLQSTKEIVNMCLIIGKKIPIHYISTASVLQYSGLDEFGEESASGYPPPPDAFEGYSASKWASEKYLNKVYEYQGSDVRWPIWIHRPTGILRSDGDDRVGGEILPTLLKYCELINAVPHVSNIRGFINLVPLERVVEILLDEMLANIPEQPLLRFCHATGDIDIPLTGLKSYVEAKTGKSAVQLSPAEFARRAAEVGMDKMLVSFFESLSSMPPLTWPRLTQGQSGLKITQN